MFVFRKIWRALFSWNTRFEIRPFVLLPTNVASFYLLNPLVPFVHQNSYTYLNLQLSAAGLLLKV